MKHLYQAYLQNEKIQQNHVFQNNDAKNQSNSQTYNLNAIY